MIHVIEDDFSVRDALQHLFTELGASSCTYSDAESFLNFLKQVTAKDCVLVDLHLPGISGVEVIKYLRELSDPPHIVAITGKSLAEINKAFTGIKRPPIVRKPLKEECLLREMDLGTALNSA
ncbi:response regulator [Polycladidibacter stylochi]|uniref:response regulator n=1 Tax=Polycladidibacter stylochi TaxID=1807766 RepID=UPI000A493BF1|nr:response regulator [Pseudovibrio stylochi]